jgi:hypothetical protein
MSMPANLPYTVQNVVVDRVSRGPAVGEWNQVVARPVRPWNVDAHLAWVGGTRRLRGTETDQSGLIVLSKEDEACLYLLLIINRFR